MGTFLSIGECMVDLCHNVTDDFFNETGLVPGSWNLYDPSCEKSRSLYSKILNLPLSSCIAGGSPSNVSTNLSFLGGDVTFFSVRGNDENSNVHLDHFSRVGIHDFSYSIEGKNPFLHALIDSSCERTFFAYTGVTPQLDFSRINHSGYENLIISGYETFKVGQPMVNFIKNFEGRVFYDTAGQEIVQGHLGSVVDILPSLSHIMLNLDEFSLIYGRNFNIIDSHEVLHGKNESLLVKLSSGGVCGVTREGNYAYAKSRVVPSSELVSCNGAGDALFSGYINGMVSHGNLHNSLFEGVMLVQKVLRLYEPHLL